ncbi:MAG TPA: PEGA domain-containing protein [Polyangia bacterium]|nr:PEGA domain-containing protein [Polyangia bacterium]
MTRSDHRSGPSRATVFALLAASLALLTASPASAKKKKTAPPADSSDSAAAGADNEVPKDASDADAKPASQANDTEKPHTILDTSQEAPKTDSLGHVHFASPNGEGLGRVVVNAPATEKVKVFLEGRLFGTAPLTIYSVPKGDYIVEAQYPNGKEISKPVTVSENEETAVDLGGAKTAKTDGGGDNGSVFSSGEMTPGRKNLMYGFLAGAVVGIAVGTTFGILDIQAENDYKNTPAGSQSQLDSIQERGQRDAKIADVGWVVTAVGLVGAGICAIPLIFGGSEKAPAAPSGTPQAFMFTPVASPAMTGGAFSMRF